MRRIGNVINQRSYRHGEKACDGDNQTHGDSDRSVSAAADWQNINQSSAISSAQQRSVTPLLW